MDWSNGLWKFPYIFSHYVLSRNKPLLASFKLTYACNLRCRQCPFFEMQSANLSFELASIEQKTRFYLSAEPDLKGYNVYVGKASRTYDTPFYVDKAQTSHTFANLSEGTYYFCVTAVDLAGNESGFSQEASKMIQDIIAPSIPQGVTVK